MHRKVSRLAPVWGLLVLLLFGPVANAEFNPFGNGIEEFYITASNRKVDLGLGYRPLTELDKLAWGPELQFVLDEGSGQDHLAVDTGFLGAYITYPVLKVDSLIDRIDANSILHMKVSALWDLGGDDGLVPGIGIVSDTEMYKSENQEILFRMEYNLYDNTDILDDRVFGLGIVARW